MDRSESLAGDQLDPLGLELPFSETPRDEQERDGLILELLQETPFAAGLEAQRFEPFASENLDPYYRDRGRGGRQAPSGAVQFPSGLSLPTIVGATGQGEEHWDPHGTGLPLLAIAASDFSKKLSPHFTVRELVTSGGVPAKVARIAPELVRVLELLRSHAGCPVKITSGYRSWQRNKAVYDARGKKPTLSRHCSGQAVDLKIAGLSGIQMATLAIDAIGTEFGLGIGRDFIHVDVRPRWDLWNYIGGAAGKAAEARVSQHRLAALGGKKTKPSPQPKPSPSPAPTPTVGNRLVVGKHPLLKTHRSRGPDLLLKWNSIPADGVIDVVVHFHGFGDPKMQVLKEKEPISGLDFAEPKFGTAGRTRSTLAVLPKGSYVGDQPGRNKIAYAFPALTKPGALHALIQDALTRVGAQTGATLTMGRLILTGHSGGGAPVRALLSHVDPDEVHILDGMYEPGDVIAKWAKARIDRELANPAALPPALRVLFFPPAKTEKHSVALWNLLCPILSPASVARLRRFFRVEKTSVDHNSIPPRYGWRLLADAGADLPSVTALPCKSFVPAVGTQESEWLADPVTTTEWLDSPVFESGNSGFGEDFSSVDGGHEHEEFEPEGAQLFFGQDEADMEDDRRDGEDFHQGAFSESEELAWLDPEAGSPVALGEEGRRRRRRRRRRRDLRKA